VSERAGELRQRGEGRRLLLICLLLVGCTVTWRRGTYFSGSVDPVVLAKAAMSVLAMALAWTSARRAPTRFARSTAAPWFVVVSVVISVFGAWAVVSTLVPALILAGRLLVVAVAGFALTRAYAATAVIKALVLSMALITSFAVISWIIQPMTAAAAAPNPIVAEVKVFTGLASGATGRLHGNLPPLAPNEVTGLCGFIVLALLWRLLHHGVRRGDVLALFGFLTMIYLTGSRTGLVALLLAIVVLLIQARRLPLGAVMAVILAVPGLFYVLFGSSLAAEFIGRGGSDNVGTLSQRTVAWSAALHLHHGFWDEWFGTGLSQLLIPVTAQFRDEQILDSSWISALVQGGILGLIVFSAWVFYTLRMAFRGPRPFRLLSTPLVLFIVLRSFLESGLLAASPTFVLFFVISVCVGRPSMGGDSVTEDAVLSRRPTVRAPVRIEPIPAGPVHVRTAR
jgi:hypothetical protein